MPDYFYDMDLVVDPLNPSNVVAMGQVAIYDPADTAGTTLLALKDPSGLPLPNPLTSNANGFLPPRIAQVPQTLWKSGGFDGYFNSFKGLRDEAVSAVAAAQGAADAATTAVAEVVTTAAVDGAGALVLTKASGATVNAGNVRGPQGVQGPAGQNGSNVLPTDTAIQQAITTPGTATATALSATYAGKAVEATVAAKANTADVIPKWKATTAYAAGAQVIAPSGDLVTAKTAFTSGATYAAADWNSSLALTTANFVAENAFSQKVKKKPDNITWITTFQAGHGWTGATDINVNSTDVQFTGTQGIKYGPADPGAARTLNSPTMAPIDMTGRQLVLALKSNDDLGAGHTVFLADAAFANYRTYVTDPAYFRSADGWVYILINPLGGGLTGTLPLTSIERIRINFNDPTGTHTELIGAVGYAPLVPAYPNGVVTIDFDDNANGQFELARPLLLAKGWPATIYSIGSTADARADGAMSTRDMHFLEDMFGWEIGAHSATGADHVAMNTLTDAQIEDSVLRVRQWLTANKFKANGFAYPFGGNDARVRSIVSKYFSWGRIAGYTSSHATPPLTAGHFIFGTQFNTTAASITTMIDTAAARKQWLGLGFHNFVAGASAGGNMGSTDFATVLDYIQSKGMAVVTPSTLLGLNR